MRKRKQNSVGYPIGIFMVDGVNHVTGKTGLSLTVEISKNGGAFAPPSGVVTELGFGWYSLDGNADDRSVLGELKIHAEANGADPFDTTVEIVKYDPHEDIDSILSDTGKNVLSEVLEDGKTLAQVLKIIASTTSGKLEKTIIEGKTYLVFSDLSGDIDRVIVEVDAQANRLEVDYNFEEE